MSLGPGEPAAADGGPSPVPEAWAAFPTDMDGLTPQPAGVAQVIAQVQMEGHMGPKNLMTTW